MDGHQALSVYPLCLKRFVQCLFCHSVQHSCKTTLRKLLFAFNTSVVVFSIISYLAAVVYVVISPVNLFEEKFTFHGSQYLPYFFSLWGSAFQSLYIFTMFAIDVMEIYSRNSMKLNKTRNNLKRFTSYLLFTAVFPMSITICTLFWALYFVDRQLIYPRIMDEFFPPWVNHSMHSIPVVLVFIYVLIEPEPPMKHTLPGMIGILAMYAACFTYVRQRYNKWVYFGLHELENERVYQLCGIGAICCILTTMLGHTISRTVHSISSFRL